MQRYRGVSGLSEIMQSASLGGLLEFTTDLGAGVAHGEMGAGLGLNNWVVVPLCLCGSPPCWVGRAVLESLPTSWPARPGENEMAEKKYIGLWLDSTSNSAPRWIVSRDTEDTTQTVASFDEDDYAGALILAKDECQRTGYPVVEIDQHGARETIYEISASGWRIGKYDAESAEDAARERDAAQRLEY